MFLELSRNFPQKFRGNFKEIPRKFSRFFHWKFINVAFLADERALSASLACDVAGACALAGKNHKGKHHGKKGGGGKHQHHGKIN